MKKQILAILIGMVFILLSLAVSAVLYTTITEPLNTGTASGQSTSVYHGLRIQMKDTGKIVAITKGSSSTADICKVYTDDGATQLGSGTFSGDVCAVDVNVTNTTYYNVIVTGSVTWDTQYKVDATGFPYIGTKMDIISIAYSGDAGTTWVQGIGTNIHSLYSVTVDIPVSGTQVSYNETTGLDYSQIDSGDPGRFGWTIQIGDSCQEVILNSVQKWSTSTPTKCNLFDSSNSLLATGSFVGDYCSLDYAMTNNQEYWIEADANGAPWDNYYITSPGYFPHVFTLFNATKDTNSAFSPISRGDSLNDVLTIYGLQTTCVSAESEACEENWTAYYTACSIADDQVLHYTDQNNCGTFEDLPVDDGELVPCNYCTIATQSHLTSCVNNSRTTYYTITNSASCCDLTGINADCNVPANSTSSCVSITGYVPQHTASDIVGVIIDFGVEYGMEIIKYVAIIALIGFCLFMMFILTGKR